MARLKTLSNEMARARTERWRLQRHSKGRPESSAVDRAVAASFAAFLHRAFESDAFDHPLVRDIILGAQHILASRGFDKRECNAELMRRLTRRADMLSLIDISRAQHSDDA
jgi:hypothetical protein